MKIITWILANWATLVGLLQAVVKAIKELLTGVVNLISLFMPQATANKIVAQVRNALNIVDAFLEKVKSYGVPK